MPHLFIQPAGNPIGKLPYPFHVAYDGRVGRQDYWHGDPQHVIGFAARYDVPSVDLSLAEAVRDPQAAVGMYLVAADHAGGWATRAPAIMEVRIEDGVPGRLPPVGSDITARARVQHAKRGTGHLAPVRHGKDEIGVIFDDGDPGDVETVSRHLVWLI